MGKDSAISWTDATFNPWWGCQKVSDGCKNCYAETWAKRTGKDCFGASHRLMFGEKHWKEPRHWAVAARKERRKKRVFCMSMGDILEPRQDLVSKLDQVWCLVNDTYDALDWMFLTKRPHRFGVVPENVLRNSWWGVTVENQETATDRIPALCDIPAKVRFISCEPLLEAVQIGPLVSRVDLVIVGGESGVNARPFDEEWARSIKRECSIHEIPFFMKQFGRNPVGRHLKDREGRDMNEWSEDLRIQELPTRPEP